MDKINELLKRQNVNTGQPIDENERTNRQVESFNNTQRPPDTITGYDCPICKNNKVIAFNDNGDFSTYNCECKDIRKSIIYLKNSGLGAVDKNTFENYSANEQWQQDILFKAQQFASAPLGGWFFIGGQVGAGKTHIGKAIAYEYIKKGIFVKYLEWKKDIQHLNALANTPEYEKAFNEFVVPPVLYIDDFLKTSNGSPLPGAINRASDLIYARYNQTDTTVIISSELTIGKIIDIDEGMGSRIVEKTKTFDSLITLNPDKNKNYRLR